MSYAFAVQGNLLVMALSILYEKMLNQYINKRMDVTMQKTLILSLMGLLVLTACQDNNRNNDQIIPNSSIVIGHRGASALRPEHTLASYQKAIDDGADFIEPDLVMSQDGTLFARHENEISGTTNIADVASFANRKTTKNIDGINLTGWFSEDFSAAELKQLKARERIPALRPNNVSFNDQYTLPTLDEIIDLAASHYAKTGRKVGLYIETKHPSYFQQQNLAMEDQILQTLNAHAYSRDIAPIYLQSFEITNLKSFKNKLQNYPALQRVRLVQLLDAPSAQPFDVVLQGGTTTYADLATTIGLNNIATYAQGVGPSKSYILDATLKPTTFVQNAHHAKLLVHPYTFRPENNFLPDSLKCSAVASERCEKGSISEVQLYLNAGVDGVFADNPALAIRARNAIRTSK